MAPEALPGFEPFYTHPCVTGSLRHIYEHRGVAISENLLLACPHSLGPPAIRGRMDERACVPLGLNERGGFAFVLEPCRVQRTAGRGGGMAHMVSQKCSGGLPRNGTSSPPIQIFGVTQSPPTAICRQTSA